MAVTTKKHISSNTDPQYLDSFDLGYVTSVEYAIEQTGPDYSYFTKLFVTHNGLETFDTQQGIVTSNDSPTLIASTIVNGAGRLITTPPEVGTIYNMTRTTLPARRFGEATATGKLLEAYDNGFVLDRTVSPEAICIRDANATRNQYCNASLYISAGSFRSVASNVELISNTWTSHNGSVLSVDSGYVALSSGQPENYQYQAVTVVPGRAYKLVIEAQHIGSDAVTVGELSKRSTGESFIAAGYSIGASEILKTRVTTAAVEYQSNFTPTANTIYIAFGNGVRNSQCRVTEVSLQEYLPHYIYDSEQEGSVRLKWTKTAGSESLITLSNYDSSKFYRLKTIANDIYIGYTSGSTESYLQIGTEVEGNNELLFSFSDVGTTIPGICRATVGDSVDVYAYWPENIS